MKIEKKLWITLFVFGLFAIGFSGWIFSQSTTREKLLWDNTIRFETKKLTDGEIKSENIALPAHPWDFRARKRPPAAVRRKLLLPGLPQSKPLPAV